MPLYRVVEAPEASALRASGGLPTRSPTGQESKPFVTTWEQALRYQVQIDRLFGPTQIWRFENPNDVGEEGPRLTGFLAQLGTCQTVTSPDSPQGSV